MFTETHRLKAISCQNVIALSDVQSDKIDLLKPTSIPFIFKQVTYNLRANKSLTFRNLTHFTNSSPIIAKPHFRPMPFGRKLSFALRLASTLFCTHYDSGDDSADTGVWH